MISKVSLNGERLHYLLYRLVYLFGDYGRSFNIWMYVIFE